MILDNDVLEKAVVRSQHCQRNWDLSQNIPQADLDSIIFSVTNCPSKQNHAFYNVHAITNRDIIEQIHTNTKGFLLPTSELTTNSQVLANLVLVFEKATTSTSHKIQNFNFENGSKKTSDRDMHMAVGVAAGYANLTSSILGYRTGCCACYDNEPIKEILSLNNDVILLMGIGFPDPNRSRRIHHKNNQLFPTKTKEPIHVVYYN